LAVITTLRLPGPLVPEKIGTIRRCSEGVAFFAKKKSSAAACNVNEECPTQMIRANSNRFRGHQQCIKATIVIGTAKVTEQMIRIGLGLLTNAEIWSTIYTVIVIYQVNQRFPN